MRYSQGGGLTAEGRARREQVRLQAVERFERGEPSARVAAELRVRERSVQRWRHSWLTGGADALRSKGPASRCRLEEAQLEVLEAELGRGPLAWGWEDQRWTLGRIRQVIITVFDVEYTVPGVWYLLHRNGWSCQLGSRRAIERDDGAIEVWKKETWPRVKRPRRPAMGGSSSRTSPVSR